MIDQVTEVLEVLTLEGALLDHETHRWQATAQQLIYNGRLR